MSILDSFWPFTAIRNLENQLRNSRQHARNCYDAYTKSCNHAVLIQEENAELQHKNTRLTEQLETCHKSFKAREATMSRLRGENTQLLEQLSWEQIDQNKAQVEFDRKVEDLNLRIAKLASMVKETAEHPTNPDCAVLNDEITVLKAQREHDAEQMNARGLQYQTRADKLHAMLAPYYHAERKKVKALEKKWRESDSSEAKKKWKVANHKFLDKFGDYAP